MTGRQEEWPEEAKNNAFSALSGTVASCRNVDDCLVKCSSFRLKKSVGFSASTGCFWFKWCWSLDDFKHLFDRNSKQRTHLWHSCPFLCVMVKPYLMYSMSYLRIFREQELLLVVSDCSASFLVCGRPSGLFLFKNLSIFSVELARWVVCRRKPEQHTQQAWAHRDVIIKGLFQSKNNEKSPPCRHFENLCPRSYRMPQGTQMPFLSTEKTCGLVGQALMNP